MWILVLFDLPTDSKRNQRIAATFRKNLLLNGFQLFQYSIYIRHCFSYDNAQVFIKKIKRILPDYGKICIISLTDKQFGNMELFIGKKNDQPPEEEPQLELF